MKNKFERIRAEIKRIFMGYIDWLESFDPALGRVILLATILIPLVLIFGTIYTIIGYNLMGDCLESESPRRYHDIICEEYIDSEWVKVDPNEKAPVYYYNEDAARIKAE